MPQGVPETVPDDGLTTRQRRNRPLLIVHTGPMKGKSFVFDEHDTFLFGRMSDCHACLPEDKSVSRHHFILEVNPPDARVSDLGSMNGTYVNDVRHGGREDDHDGARRVTGRAPEMTFPRRAP